MTMSVCDITYFVAIFDREGDFTQPSLLHLSLNAQLSFPIVPISLSVPYSVLVYDCIGIRRIFAIKLGLDERAL